MHANLTGLLAVVLAVVGFGLSYKFLRTRRLGERLIWLGVFLVLSVPAGLFAVYYLHVLPEEAWFYRLRAMWGAEFWVVPLGCAGGCVGTLLPRWLIGVPLFGVVLAGVAPYLKPVLAPLDYGTLENRWKGGACLQSASSTCGAASMASVLKELGVATTEREVARAAFSYGGGTEAWYLARYARGKGARAEFVFGEGFLPEVELPAIVGVKMGGMGHFVAVLRREGEMLVVADPLVGEERMTRAEFARRYRFSGFHLVVGR